MPKHAEVPYRKLAEIQASTMKRLEDDNGFTAQILHTLGVPSLSPGTTYAMMNVLDGAQAAIKQLDERIAGQTDPLALEQAQLARRTLVGYHNSLLSICNIAAHQQQATIDAIEGTLRKQHAVDLGLKPEDADGLETAIDLLALANLGRQP